MFHTHMHLYAHTAQLSNKVHIDLFSYTINIEFQDYNGLSQSLTFVAPLPAQSVMTTSLEILDDNEVEPCEQLNIELSSLSERAVVEGDGKAVIQINDDEGKMLSLFILFCLKETQ